METLQPSSPAGPHWSAGPPPDGGAPALDDIGGEVAADAGVLKQLLAEVPLAAAMLDLDLHEPGLTAGLRWLVRWMLDRHGLEVDLQIDEQDLGERDEVRVLVFESTRELLFNVVKHAGVRRVRVDASRSDAGRLLRVVVSDHGLGFDSNAPAGEADRHTGGFGLFSIFERLSLLGGSLDIDSALGSGTRITIVAPLAGGRGREATATAAAASAENGDAGSAGRRIRDRMVDDHPVVRTSLSALLTAHGDVDVDDEASSGQDAIGLVEAVQPDVVLMDYSMPWMNGAEATRQIHARWLTMRVVGRSMHDKLAVSAAMLAAGASAYATKGGDAEALLAATRASS